MRRELSKKKKIQSLEVVFRYRDPQLQICKNLYYLCQLDNKGVLKVKQLPNTNDMFTNWFGVDYNVNNSLMHNNA